MLLNYINNYKDIIETINKYKIINNRDIRLVVVSKTQDYKKIIELEKLGQRDFGAVSYTHLTLPTILLV